jgi:3-methyladenine DNA glycosylase/8-oxoguanine DNA glycosylase
MPGGARNRGTAIAFREAALRLLRGETARQAAARAGIPAPGSFARDFLLRLHATPDALRGWGEAGRYRLVYGGPFHLKQTLSYLGRDPHNLAERVEGRRYARSFPVGSTTVAVSLALGERRCIVTARRPRSPRRALELHERLVRFLGLTQPLAAFYRVAAGHAVMDPLVRRFAGVRIPQLPTLWEALCWAVIGQQINLAFAYRLRNRLIALAHGVAPDAARQAPYAFPSPAAVLRLSAEDLRGQQFSRQKASYLLGLAEACSTGDLAGLEHGAQDWPDIEQRLLAQRGLGPWSTAYAMMRGLGYLDGLPVGDSGLRTALQRAFRLAEPPSVMEQERLMEPFRPYRSLATYYLWKSLATTSTD